MREFKISLRMLKVSAITKNGKNSGYVFKSSSKRPSWSEVLAGVCCPD